MGCAVDGKGEESGPKLSIIVINDKLLMMSRNSRLGGGLLFRDLSRLLASDSLVDVESN